MEIDISGWNCRIIGHCRSLQKPCLFEWEVLSLRHFSNIYSGQLSYSVSFLLHLTADLPQVHLNVFSKISCFSCSDLFVCHRLQAAWDRSITGLKADSTGCLCTLSENSHYRIVPYIGKTTRVNTFKLHQSTGQNNLCFDVFTWYHSLSFSQMVLLNSLKHLPFWK